MSENITAQMLDSLLSQAQPLPSYVDSSDYVEGFNNAILYVRNLLSCLQVDDKTSVSDKIINELNTGLRAIVDSHVGEFADSKTIRRICDETDNLVEDTFSFPFMLAIVRRLLMFMEEVISESSRFVVFEPNPQTWRALSRLINPFLQDIKDKGGLYDFAFQCDEETNTPAVIDRNEMVARMFVKPTKTAEFIELNFILTSTQRFLRILIGLK